MTSAAHLDDLAALLAPLHAPFACKSLRAPNRFCMAPMSRYFAPGGVLTNDGAEYYRRRAAAGIGTIITEGTGVAIDHTVAADNVPLFVPRVTPWRQPGVTAERWSASLYLKHREWQAALVFVAAIAWIAWRMPR